MANVEEIPKRAPNFSLAEKVTLLNIVVKYKDIIEDKKTDRSRTEEKEKAWKKIADEFNAVSPASIYRSAICLRKAYDNKKKEIRKLVAEEKREIMKTGGGPPVKIKHDECYDIILSIVNEKTIHGLQNDYDSDAVEKPISLTESENIFEFVPETDKDNQSGPSCEFTNEITDDTNYNWKKYTPSQLKRPVSQPLKEHHLDTVQVGSEKCNRRRTTTRIRALSSSNISEKYDLLMDKRLKIANLQLEELKKNDKRAEEKHELEKKIMNYQLEKLQQEIEINKYKNKLMYTK